MVNGAFSTVVRTVHDLTTMRELILKYAETSGALEARTRAAEEKAAKAERDRDAAAEKEARLRKESASELREKEEALIKARARAAQVAADLDHREVQLRLAIGRAEAGEGRAAASEERAAKLRGEAEAAESRAKAAESRVEAAEARVRQAEARAREAEERVSRVVEEYKDSDDFERDAATACVGMYDAGFIDCRQMIAEAHPGLNLQGIVPPGAPEESEEETEGAEGPVVVTEAGGADTIAAEGEVGLILQPADPVVATAVEAVIEILADADTSVGGREVGLILQPAALSVDAVMGAAVGTSTEGIVLAPGEVIVAGEIGTASGAPPPTPDTDPPVGAIAKS